MRWLEVAVSLCGLVAFWAAGSNRPWGWSLAFANQAVWCLFAVVTGQWGLMVSVVGFAAVFARNAWRTHHPVEVMA